MTSDAHLFKAMRICSLSNHSLARSVVLERITLRYSRPISL